VLLLVLVLVLVLVLEEVWYSNSTHRSASSREPLRSTIGIAAVQTSIEYEYRFAESEYEHDHEHEHEYDESRCDARTRFDVDQIIVPELGSYNSVGRAR